MAKRIIVVHGRSTKPKKSEKLRLVRQALEHGINRVSTGAANKISKNQITVDLAYYGDINNAILWAHEQRPPKKFVEDYLERWNYSYEQNGRYDAAMTQLFSRANQHHTERHYHELRDRVRDNRAIDNILDIISPIANLIGINDELVNKALPDLGAYFEHRIVGSAIRARLQEILVPRLQASEDICLVSHSMGTIVAYDVLWKLSRMSEYREVRDKKVNLFITLGSPLGDPVVSKQLYDSNEPSDGRYPTNIVDWINFSAKDDYISRDENPADNFSEMISRKLVRKISDKFIYNFWVDQDKLNPHKSYGYLDNPHVAKALADWIG